MKIVIASGNRGKIREFKDILKQEVTPFYELLGDIDIVEDGTTFAQNALIKAREIYSKLGEEYIVISDDSGISVDELDGQPNIYSARFAGESANDKENLQKLIDMLKSKNLTSSKAHYTAAIAVVSKLGEYLVHGWMHGDVTTTAKGDKGFGYDPIFIPLGYNQTLGELDDSIKQKISHRFKALDLAKPIIEILQRG